MRKNKTVTLIAFIFRVEDRDIFGSKNLTDMKSKQSTKDKSNLHIGRLICIY